MPTTATTQRKRVRLGLNRTTGRANDWINFRLPDSFQHILLRLGAFYRKDAMGVRLGLEAGHDHNQAYLGTYFPRTVMEMAIIWAEMMVYEPIRQRFAEKRTVRLASFGSGTGGDIVGAMLALARECKGVEQVHVYSFDGNEDAIEKQKAIIQMVIEQRVFPFEVEYHPHCFTWGLERDSFAESCQHIKACLPGSLDMVQASKWLIEFYNHHFIHSNSNQPARGIVEEWLRFADEVVDEDGIALIADMTTQDPGEWFPMILNREALKYLSDASARMKTISPIPCALQNGVCRSGRSCYTRRQFAVSTCFCSNDVSQLCYRAFAPMDFARDVISGYERRPYRVNWTREQDCQNGVRGNFIQTEEAASGFSAYTAGEGV